MYTLCKGSEFQQSVQHYIYQVYPPSAVRELMMNAFGVNVKDASLNDVVETKTMNPQKVLFHFWGLFHVRCHRKKSFIASSIEQRIDKLFAVKHL